MILFYHFLSFLSFWWYSLLSTSTLMATAAVLTESPTLGNLLPAKHMVDMSKLTPAHASQDQRQGMLEYVTNWVKLLSLAPVDINMYAKQPSTCRTSPGQQLPNRISDHEARIYAKYAAAAYCILNSALYKWTCSGHCSGGTEGTVVEYVGFDYVTQIKYFVAINHRLKSIVVSVRGTLYPMNYIVDFSWVQLSLDDFPGIAPGVMVHAGFLLASLRIAQDIRERVLALAVKYSDYTVDFTGHSMGGGVSQLVALNIIANTPIPPSRVRVFSYGAPRVGNPQYASLIAHIGLRSFTRIVADNDPVPHLPLMNMFLLARYQHAPGEKYLMGVWMQSDFAGTNGIIDTVSSTVRNVTPFKPRSVDCMDLHCEDPACSASRFPLLNFPMHLRVYDVVFGPWY